MINEQPLKLYQFVLLLLHAQIGVGIVKLVYDVHQTAKSDSWISVLLAGLFIQLLIFLYGLIIKRFPNENYFRIIEIVFGKRIGKIILFVHILYLTYILTVVIAQYVNIIKTWMMPLTPKWILALLISVVAVYAAKENLHVISRFFILASFVIVIFIVIILFAFKDANYTYILPIGKAGIKNIFFGAVSTSYAYQGLAYLLILFPYVNAPNKKVVAATSYLNLLITFIYFLTVLVILMFFSTKELDIIIEPIFYLIKSYSIMIIERPDILFTSSWLVIAVTSSVMVLYISSFGLQMLFNKKRREPFVYLVIIISLILSLFIYGEYHVLSATRILNKAIIFFAFVIPVLTLFFSYILNKRGET